MCITIEISVIIEVTIHIKLIILIYINAIEESFPSDIINHLFSLIFLSISFLNFPYKIIYQLYLECLYYYFCYIKNLIDYSLKNILYIYISEKINSILNRNSKNNDII